jgi:hypothetical protein
MGCAFCPRGPGSRSLDRSRGSHAPKGADEKVVHRAKPGRCVRYSEKERYARCEALNRFSRIIQERGKRGLPLEDLYRHLYHPDWYLKAYGKIYRNAGAMTRGSTAETVDGMALSCDHGNH